MQVLLDQTVSTDYGQFTVEWSDRRWGDMENVAEYFSGQANGWVAAAMPGVLHVVLARRSGGSRVRIELWEREPGGIKWDVGSALYSSEDCVEVSIAIPSGAEPRWAGWGGLSGGQLALPPGSYRVRVRARGRDAGRDGEFEDHVVDEYLLQLWPAEAATDEILATGSDDAAAWNREWGNRR